MRASLLLALLLALSCSTSTGGGSGRRVPPNDPWRATRPVAGPPASLKLPVFQKAELKNGLTLFVVEEHSIPIVTAAVVVRAGSALESTKDAGLAMLTYDLLDEGAGTMNSQALANAFSSLGATLQTGARRDYGTVRVELLKKHLNAGLELLGTVVRKPTFAPADVDRERSQLIAGLKESEGDPDAIAQSLNEALIFGSEHPYGHDERGTVGSLEKLSAARVKKFWTDSAGPKSAALVLAGDITLDEAKALAETHFGKWSGGPKAARPPVDPRPREALRIALVDIEGSQQSVVRMGRAVMARGDADEAALVVFNEIVGGGFSSRLNIKLREEKQWTYGAFSYAERRLGKGPFVLGTSVQTPNTADAVAEIMAQLEAVKAAGVTDDELVRAKAGWVRSLPGSLGSPAVQADAASILFSCDLPLDYYDKLVTTVNALTLDDIKRVATRTLVPGDMALVIVGDKAQIEAPLREKGLTAIELFGRNGLALK